MEINELADALYKKEDKILEDFIDKLASKIEDKVVNDVRGYNWTYKSGGRYEKINEYGNHLNRIIDRIFKRKAFLYKPAPTPF